MNKDSINPTKKNSVVTPEEAKAALQSLPFNYVLLAFEKLKKWKNEGKIKKSFSRRYIIKVQRQEDGAFNKDILDALVEIGIENLEIRNQFGRITKKTSPEN